MWHPPCVKAACSILSHKSNLPIIILIQQFLSRQMHWSLFVPSLHRVVLLMCHLAWCTTQPGSHTSFRSYSRRTTGRVSALVCLAAPWLQTKWLDKTTTGGLKGLGGGAARHGHLTKALLSTRHLVAWPSVTAGPCLPCCTFSSAT